MSDYKIANTHNNAAGLQALDALIPPLFAAYTGGIVTDWHAAEAQIMTGDRRLCPVGLPYVVWHLHRLSAAELLYIRATFGAQVTIRTLNKTAGAFGNFNATLEIDSGAWRANGWDSVKLTLWELVGL